MQFFRGEATPGLQGRSLIDLAYCGIEGEGMMEKFGEMHLWKMACPKMKEEKETGGAATLKA